MRLIHSILRVILRPVRAVCSAMFAIVFAILVTLSSTAFAEPEPVEVWIYHNFAPFVIDGPNQQGLSFDLARRLTDMSEGRYSFDVYVLPRGRINLRLSEGMSGFVFWGNPAWFGDSKQETYFWSQPLLRGQSVIISPSATPVDYETPASLTGARLAGIRGHRYVGVDELVEAGEASRYDVSDEAGLVKFIASGRAEAAVIARSAVEYLTAKYDIEDQIHVAPVPHSEYERHILAPKSMEAAFVFTQEAIEELTDDPQWRDLLASYGFDPL